MIVANDGSGGGATERMDSGGARGDTFSAKEEEGPHSSLNGLRLGGETLGIGAEFREAL